MKPFYEKDGITIYCGDCREIIPALPAVDVVITDPPYGVNLGEADQRGGEHGLAKKSYDGYADTYENFVAEIVPRLNECLDATGRAAVFTGPHIHEQRKPDSIGGVYCPAATGRTRWGRKQFLPVLFYGTAPDLNKGARFPTAIASSATSEAVSHPCPKPLEWMRWLVTLSSRVGETILDPFMGSGTTLLAAKIEGRKAIGIEINPAYCEVAKQRLRQKTMF